MSAGGGVKSRDGLPASPSRSVNDTASIGLLELPSPTTLNGLSGSAMKLAAARSGVYPTNHADRVSSVVPVLPATGRPTIPYTPGAVDQSPHEPVTAPYPVTHLAASVAARATASLTARWHRGLAASTGAPLASVPIAGVPSGRVMDSTGSGWQYMPSPASVA